MSEFSDYVPIWEDDVVLEFKSLDFASIYALPCRKPANGLRVRAPAGRQDHGLQDGAQKSRLPELGSGRSSTHPGSGPRRPGRLYDWSVIEDEGFRNENMAAVHLLKSVQLWTDLGLGEFSLHYLRDKSGREVDFLVARGNRPWFLLEVKSSGNRPLHADLGRFQEQTGAGHAFQLAMDLPYIDADCFARGEPAIVPGLTLLSQLA